VAPIRGETVRATILWMVPLWLVACRDEPTIVIKFEPNDMTAAAAARAPSVDAAPAVAAPKAPADLGAAAKGPIALVPDKKSECKTAADCVVEPAECCDCANGGKQHAIPKSRAAASKAARAKRCVDVACTMMLSTDPTCGMRPDCVAGACAMIKTPATK
jgi:hypothetical protein